MGVPILSTWLRRGRQVRELAAVARRYRRERDDARDALVDLWRAIHDDPAAMKPAVAKAFGRARDVLQHPSSP